MKRSEVNRAVLWGLDIVMQNHFHLPPFGYWRLDEWKARWGEIGVIRELMLGWDVTDFSSGDFARTGAVLFTLRNGRMDRPGTGTPYAEKLILIRDGQWLPMHFHIQKTEDIINRAGGVLALRLYNADPETREPDRTGEVKVYMDGMERTVSPGEILEIGPGASITLTPYLYHAFGAKAGAGDLMAGEVSSVNDDRSDNYFAEDIGRFSAIEEDECILYPLCNEYDKIL